MVVADTSLFVALFDGADRHHLVACDYMRELTAPLVSNLAVITETVHLLDFNRRAAADFLSWIDKAVDIDQRTRDDWPRIIQIFNKYSNLTADFADASLVALCERIGTDRIATLDRDFHIYRLGNRRRFAIEFGKTA